MPLYSFELRDGSAPLLDKEGVNLPDRDRALAYAQGVIRELMQGREDETRAWQLDVYENHGERVFELPFAPLDATLNHLRPEVRNTLEISCGWRRASREAVYAARVTRRESRALLALARGRPYLAAIAGERTIR